MYCKGGEMSRPKFCLNSVNTDNCPCRFCTTPKRHTGCHATCDEYIEWNDDHKKKLAERQHKKDMDEIYYNGAARRNAQLKQKGVSFGRRKK